MYSSVDDYKREFLHLQHHRGSNLHWRQACLKHGNISSSSPDDYHLHQMITVFTRWSSSSPDDHPDIRFSNEPVCLTSQHFSPSPLSRSNSKAIAVTTMMMAMTMVMVVTIMTIVMATMVYHDDYYLRRGGSCSRGPARPGRAVNAAFWRPGKSFGGIESFLYVSKVTLHIVQF